MPPKQPEPTRKASPPTISTRLTKAKKKTPTANMVEIGTSGILMSGGRPETEWLPALKGDKALKVWKEMKDNEPTVGALLFAFEMLARKVEWYVDEGENDAPSEAVDLVSSAMHDMSSTWEDHVGQFLTMLPFGWSFHEIVYKRREGWAEDSSGSKYDDGKFGWRKIPIRLQETRLKWEIDDTGGLQGFHQLRPSGGQVYVPIERGLLFRTTSANGSPEGRTILRTAYRPWYIKKRIEEIEGIGIERDLAGMPVAWAPAEFLSDQASSAEQETIEKLKELVRNIRRDEQEGLVFPLAYDDRGNKVYDLSLLSTGSRRQFDIDTTIRRYETRIAMCVLADFIMLGHEKLGSFALGATRLDMFVAVVEVLALQNIETVFNQYAIPRLMGVNGMDPSRSPRLRHKPVTGTDLGMLAQLIVALSQAGAPIFPNHDLQSFIFERAGLPSPPEPDDADASPLPVQHMGTPADPDMPEPKDEQETQMEAGAPRGKPQDRKKTVLEKQPAKPTPKTQGALAKSKQRQPRQPNRSPQR